MLADSISRLPPPPSPPIRRICSSARRFLVPNSTPTRKAPVDVGGAGFPSGFGSRAFLFSVLNRAAVASNRRLNNSHLVPTSTAVFCSGLSPESDRVRPTVIDLRCIKLLANGTGRRRVSSIESGNRQGFVDDTDVQSKRVSWREPFGSLLSLGAAGWGPVSVRSKWSSLIPPLIIHCGLSFMVSRRMRAVSTLRLMGAVKLLGVAASWAAAESG